MRPAELPTTRRFPSPIPLAVLPEIDGTTPVPPNLNWPKARGYEILSPVGAGGMGVVYKARHRELLRTVALKTLGGVALGDPEYRARFRAEAEAVARLQHPNIIQVFEVGTLDPRPGELVGGPFIALEFVDGGSLARLTETPQAPRDAARMVEKLARAAHAAHQLGVVHRDLKPANVLLTRDGVPKIADFGVAKQLDDPGGRLVTRAGIAVGTPEYMAPEQVDGDTPTAAIDTYALGVILYELLTGRLPFRGANPAATMDLVRYQEPVSPRRLQPGLPKDLETVCLKCLEKDPARRYESADALADDLASWADGRTIRARTVGPVGRAARWARRSPTVAGLSAAVVLIALIGVVGVVLKWQEAQRSAEAALVSEAEARGHARAERWERYRAEIVAASSALRLGDVIGARRALGTAPAEHRNWEWQYFAGKLDTSRHTLVGLDSGSPHVELAAAARRVAVVAADQSIHVWDVAARQKAAVVPADPALSFCCMDPTGTALAYTQAPPNNHTVVLRDAGTGRVRAVLRGHEGGVGAIRFSPDGTGLATGSVDGTVRVWDAATGATRLVLEGLTHPSPTLTYSPDGRRLACLGSRVQTVRVWDAGTGRLLNQFDDHGKDVAAVGFSPAGDRVVVVEGYPSNRVRLWDPATGALVAVLAGHRNRVTAFAFSPDGRRLATTAVDQTVMLWDGATGDPVATLLGHTGRVFTAAFSPDGARLVSAAEDQSLRLWDGRTGAPLGVMHGHAGEVHRAAFTADGGTIVSASKDGTVRLWDARSAEHPGTLRGHTSYVYGVAVHPDGRRVASAAWDGTVRVWDAATGRAVWTAAHADHAQAVSVAFHRDGRLVASLGRDGAVRLWDADTGRPVHHWPIPGHDYLDARLAFSPRGDLLAAGGGDGNVYLFDPAARAAVAVLRGHRHTVRDVAFSPDGRWLASGGDHADRTVRVWDVARREQVRVLDGHADRVYALAFHPAGTLLASGSTDGTVRLWDTATWAEVGVLRQESNVYAVAFTPGGSRLAAACADNTIRFWDVATRQEVAELRGHTDYVHAIAFSPDGRRLVSGSGDATVRVWDIR